MTLVQYESVAVDRGQTGHNRWWQINDAGELYYHRNTPASVRPNGSEVYWFDAPRPTQPTLVLSAEKMQALRAHLHTFADWPTHTRRDCDEPERGGWDRLRIMCDERTIEIELHSAYADEMKALIAPIQALWRDQ